MDGVGEHIHRVPDEVDIGLLGLDSDDINMDTMMMIMMMMMMSEVRYGRYRTWCRRRGLAGEAARHRESSAVSWR